MKNNFAEEYAIYMGLEKKWDDAEMDDATEEELDSIRAEYHQFEESLKAQGDGYCATFKDYANSKKHGNAYIDKDDISFETAEQMIARFKKFGIDKFTWSSGWTDAVEDAWKFIECGCRLEGMTQVNTGWDRHHERYMTRPAYIFSI